MPILFGSSVYKSILLALAMGISSWVYGASEPKSHREMLDAFTGHWEGTFEVFRYDGKLVSELNVRQHYWWDNDVQYGHFVERDRDGKTVHVRAKNNIQDGQLVCQVTKDSGEHSEHHGRYSETSLFWSRQTPDVVECFQDRVMDRDDGCVYEIHGFGVYGHGANSSHFYFEGKYR